LLIAPLQAHESYSQIELDDLNDSQASEGVALDMKDSQRYFESRAINEEDTSNRQKVGDFVADDSEMSLMTNPG
jgi:transcription initiation factor TFIIH subunit 1